ANDRADSEYAGRIITPLATAFGSDLADLATTVNRVRQGPVFTEFMLALRRRLQQWPAIRAFEEAVLADDKHAQSSWRWAGSTYAFLVRRLLVRVSDAIAAGASQPERVLTHSHGY